MKEGSPPQGDRCRMIAHTRGTGQAASLSYIGDSGRERWFRIMDESQEGWEGSEDGQSLHNAVAVRCR